MSIITEHISYAIHDHIILKDVSVDCKPGDMVALVGPSGCGKTTMLGILGLLIAPNAGDIYIDRRNDSQHWSDARRRGFWKQKAAFIYQDYGLVEDETVAYNVTMKPRALFGRRSFVPDDVEEALRKVGLSGRGGETVSFLSGGEKQRVGVARAIYKQARYIFADEPTASLDKTNREMVTSLLEREASRGACVIVSTHDMELAGHCNRIVDLTDARESPCAQRL
jgi:putative ABC transport system ATP-binding protein